VTSWTFTSESVTEGHPDKMADQISDAILDAILTEDPDGRVACETLLTTGLVVVAGEISTSAYIEIPRLVREVVCGIGYDRSAYGFDGHTCGVTVSIDSQSPDIAQGVDTALEVRSGTSGEDVLNAQGAGDQGMMFGYACRSGWHTGCRNGYPRFERPACCRISGLTARPRSPCSTKTAAPSG